MITRNTVAKLAYTISEAILTASPTVHDVRAEISEIAQRIEKELGSTVLEERRQELVALTAGALAGVSTQETMGYDDPASWAVKAARSALDQIDRVMGDEAAEAALEPPPAVNVQPANQAGVYPFKEGESAGILFRGKHSGVECLLRGTVIGFRIERGLKGKGHADLILRFEDLPADVSIEYVEAESGVHIVFASEPEPQAKPGE